MKKIIFIMLLSTITTYSPLDCQLCLPHEAYGEISYNTYNNEPGFIIHVDTGSGHIYEEVRQLNEILFCEDIDLIIKLLDAGARDKDQWNYNHAMQAAQDYLEIAKAIKKFEEKHALKDGPQGLSYEQYLQMQGKQATTLVQDPSND